MSCLVLRVPLSRGSERQYVAQVILGEFLGLEHQVIAERRDDWCLTIGEGLPSLRMPDCFLRQADRDWLRPSSLPCSPLPLWRVGASLPEVALIEPQVPIIAGRPSLQDGCLLELKGNNAWLGLDVLGSAFFMLTQYEELCKPDRDKHGRFPVTSSLAFQEGFLERPIVDEYVEILWACMRRLWPGLQRTERSYRLVVSHDVDRPILRLFSPAYLVRSCVGDLMTHRNLMVPTRRARSWLLVKLGRAQEDKLDTFGQMMVVEERHGLSASYNFMAGAKSFWDARYSIDDPWIRGLMKKVRDRGHVIGFHGGYETYRDPSLTRQQFATLVRACETEGIRQDTWGGRQHFLRWEAPHTWQNWEDAGLQYDSTVGFADHVGFRCGTCCEYPVFNLVTGKRLRLRELPLVAMDGTLLDFMSLDSQAMLERLCKLNARCRLYGGDFTLLWHNDSLAFRDAGVSYGQILEELGC